MKEISSDEQLIALDLVDYVVVECNLPLHNQISTKDFITTLLSLLKQKDSVNVQYKILSLIKKWGIRFETKKDVLPNFFETYNSLKVNGVVFPEKIESTYFKYTTDNSIKTMSNINPNANPNNQNFNPYNEFPPVQNVYK